MRPPTQPPDPPPTPARSTIEIGSVSGAPGSSVQIAVTLHTDEVIAAVQNDLHVDLPASIAADSDGRPACTRDPSVDWLGPGFAFHPPACIPGVDCTGIRAILLPETPQPLVDGAVLYTCTVTIAAGTSGHADLHCSNSLGSTPDGQQLAVGCTAGRVNIAPLNTTPPLAPSPTPPPLSGSSLQSSGGGGGCQIGAATDEDAPWWLVLAPLALVLLRTRRAPLRRRHARDQSLPSHPAGGDGAPPSAERRIAPQSRIAPASMRRFNSALSGT